MAGLDPVSNGFSFVTSVVNLWSKFTDLFNSKDKQARKIAAEEQQLKNKINQGLKDGDVNEIKKNSGGI